MLLAIPLVLTGTGYALFSQQLSVNTTTTNPAYTTSNNLQFSYTKTLSTQGQKTVFTIVGTVKNLGTTNTASWQVMFDMPADFGNFTCDSAAVCSTSGATATIKNGTGNGTIPTGGTVSFTISFSSSSTNYTLQNLSVAGTVPAVYQTISGLTLSVTHGNSTKAQGTYSWPYTFTVTNNSGSPLQAWRITAPWNTTTTNTVTSMSSTVNYLTNATQITILSTTGLANGSSIVFNATFTSKASTWALTGSAIQGAY
jgi:hypothetical protein